MGFRVLGAAGWGLGVRGSSLGLGFSGSTMRFKICLQIRF
jgi:hypothetical protein